MHTFRPKEGISVDQQRHSIVRYARRNGLEIAKWFVETRRSAYDFRPVFQRMLKELKSGKASGIITDRYDRLSRNLAEWPKIRELVNRGVELRFTAGPPRQMPPANSKVIASLAASFLKHLEESKAWSEGRTRRIRMQ